MHGMMTEMMTEMMEWEPARQIRNPDHWITRTAG